MKIIIVEVDGKRVKGDPNLGSFIELEHAVFLLKVEDHEWAKGSIFNDGHDYIYGYI